MSKPTIDKQIRAALLRWTRATKRWHCGEDASFIEYIESESALLALGNRLVKEKEKK